MMIEKRQSPRIRVSINARWEGVLTRHFGTVTDISHTGCFILTVDAVTVKELLRVEIQLLNGKWIYFWGEVVYRAPEIGFGLRFTGANDSEQKMIDALIDYATFLESPTDNSDAPDNQDSSDNSAAADNQDDSGNREAPE